MQRQPLVSVIIPVHNAAHDLTHCLEAIKKSSYSSYEIIVVNDGSSDESAEVAFKNGALVHELQSQSGPAAARNFGAEKAKGDILLFVDSDVLIQPETIARVVRDFSKNPHIGALFGSYDDDPAKKNFCSQYMNLRHHFVHQISGTEAVTFWAGCGAVRKNMFFSVGGFDNNKYSRPSIEDIEMGYRFKKMGYRILLDKELQVKHLKKWTLKSLLRTDIFHRAIPWAQLMLENQEIAGDLNLKLSQKISTGLLGLAIILFALSFYFTELIYLIPLFVVGILVLNYKLFDFFLRRNGFKFTLLAFGMYLLYFFYSGATFSLCWLSHKFRT